MFPTDLENAYVHEVERRKDEIRAAARHNFENQYHVRRKLPALPMAILSILSLVLAILIGH